MKEASDSITIYSNLGECLFQKNGDFEAAISFANKSIQIKADQREFNSLNTLASILANSKDSLNLIKAIQYSEEALQESKLIQDDENIEVALNNLAFANKLLGNFNKAIRYYEQAYEITDKTEILSKAIVLNNISIVYKDQNKHGLSIETLKKSLDLFKHYFETDYNFEYSAVFENLADNYTALQQIDTALLYYQKSLINLSNNFRTENIFQNPNPKDTSLFIYSNPDMIRVLHLKATAAFKYYQQNQNIRYLNLANQTYQTTFNFHDKLQKDISTENSRLFQAKNIVPYIENALKVAFELQEKGQSVGEAALRFMEKNKATVLLQSMNEADALQFANLPDSLIEQEKELKIAITYHSKQLNEAIEYEENDEVNRINDLLFEEKQQYRQLISQLENNYPNYYRLKYQQNQTTLTDIQNTLNNQTALLEYFVGDSIYILSIQKDRAKLYQLKKPDEWQQVLTNFRLALTDKKLLQDGIDNHQDLFVTSAHRLYQCLLNEPLNNIGDHIDRLQIIPDGELNNIPFELLLTEQVVEKNQVDYKKLPYVFKDKSVGYLYAGSFLKYEKENAADEQLLSLAGFSANYQNSKLDALPHSEACVSSIAKKNNGISYTSATRQNFITEAGKYKALLLTMHAQLDDKNAMNSALIFSPTMDSLDNKLRAADLYNTTLNAEMAVLSACETGVGKIHKGEGVMSLSRAFTYAGCPSLVMSLWSIPNQSTSQLTESFFYYLDKGLPKDKALQQAKLAYLKNAPSRLSHPVYWAGLVATGDLSPVDINGQSCGCLSWVIILLLVLGLVLLYFILSKRKLVNKFRA